MDQTSEYHCNICRKTFEEFVIFEGHFNFYTKCRALGPCIQCYICGESFSHFAVLKYHLKYHLQCHSNNEIRKIKALSKNRDEVGPAKGFDCSVCKKSFKTKFHLTEHLTIHFEADVMFQNGLNESSKETNSQNMNLTNEGHRTNFHLIDHLKTHSTADTVSNEQTNGSHEEILVRKTLDRCSSNKRKKLSAKSRKVLKDYRCQVCNVNCYNKVQLDKHITRLHIDGLVKCELCNIRFMQKTLTRHNTLVHQSTNSFSCEYCNLVFSYSLSLTKHLKVHHLGTVTCSICEIKFTSKSLARHKRLAHPELLLVPKKSIKIGKLRPSSFSHDSSAESLREKVRKDYRCPTSTEIKKALQNASSNEIAPRLERDEIESHQCKICKASYCTKERLEHHVECHNGAYRCEVCNIPFTKQTLWRHIKQTHPTFQKPKILKFSCKVCIVNCSTPQELEEHMKVHSDDDFYREDHANPYVSLEGDITSTTEEIPVDQYSEYVRNTVNQQYPPNVTLSNWNPDKLREILENISLVLVEKLDGRRSKNCIFKLNDQCKNQSLNEVLHPNSERNENDIKSDFECNSIERDRYELKDDVDIGIEGFEENPYSNSNFQNSNEDAQLPEAIDADHSVNNSVRSFDCDLVEGVTLEEFEEQQNAEEEVHRDIEDVGDEAVVDISSDSDDDIERIYDESADPHYCCYCEKVFYSLHDLGKHNKMCYLRN